MSIHRLRCANGEPLAVMTNHLPAEIAPDADELESTGLYQSLRARGVHIRLARQRIGARRPPVLRPGCSTRNPTRRCSTMAGPRSTTPAALSSSAPTATARRGTTSTPRWSTASTSGEQSRVAAISGKLASVRALAERARNASRRRRLSPDAHASMPTVPQSRCRAAPSRSQR